MPSTASYRELCRSLEAWASEGCEQHDGTVEFQPCCLDIDCPTDRDMCPPCRASTILLGRETKQ